MQESKSNNNITETDIHDPYKTVTFLPDELGNLAAPLHYDLHLFLPELETTVMSFEGYVHIKLMTLKETNKIALHADPEFLNIRAVAVKEHDQSSWNPVHLHSVRQNLGVEGHVLELALPAVMRDGKLLSLLFIFEGRLGNSPHGMFQAFGSQTPELTAASAKKKRDDSLDYEIKCNHTNNAHQLNSMLRHGLGDVKPVRTIATSLEPLFSRRLFPCFDSLNLKATFSVAVSFRSSEQTPSSSPIPPVKAVSSTSPVCSVASEYPLLFSFLRLALPPSTLRQKTAVLDGVLNSSQDEDRESVQLVAEKLGKEQDRDLERKSLFHCCFQLCRGFVRKPNGSQRRPLRQAGEETEKATIRLAPLRFGSAPLYLSQCFESGPSSPVASDTTVKAASLMQVVSTLEQPPEKAKADTEFLGVGSREEAHRKNDKLRNKQAAPLTEAENREGEKQMLYRTTLFETTPLLPCYAVEICLGHFVEYSPSFHSTGHMMVPTQRQPFSSVSSSLSSTRKTDDDSNAAQATENKYTATERAATTTTTRRAAMNEASSCSPPLPPLRIRICAQLVPPYECVPSDFSLFISHCCLHILQSKWSTIPYPIDKLDLIPLPTHRGLGMENFGCITFDDRYFFVTVSTARRRALRIARLICHEISHMWIGDLLTPPSFDELWLKEGVARFIEYCVLLHIFPASRPTPKSGALSHHSTNQSPVVVRRQTEPGAFHDHAFLSDLLEHFNFKASDVWGSFILEVFWDSLVSDSSRVFYSNRLKRRGSKQLEKSVKLYGRQDDVTRLSRTGLTGRFSTTTEFYQNTKQNKNRRVLPTGFSAPRRSVTSQESTASQMSSPTSQMSQGSEVVKPTAHPIQLQGLLKTTDIMERFNNITYGKSACILHSISEFIGGSDVFLKVIHKILKRKLPDASAVPMRPLLRSRAVTPSPQAIFTKQDFWDSIADVCKKIADDSKTAQSNNTMFLTAHSPKITPQLIEAFYDPWLMTEGIPRVAVRMSDVAMQTTPELSFSIRLVVSQLIDTPLQLRQLDQRSSRSARRQTHPRKGSGDLTKDGLRRSGSGGQRKGPVEPYQQDRDGSPVPLSASTPSLDSSSVLTIPLLLSIDDEDYRLLVQNEEVEIEIRRTYNQVTEGGLANGVRLRINPNAAAYCTFHPCPLCWDALFNGVRLPSDQYEERDLSILMVTIIEDARLRHELSNEEPMTGTHSIDGHGNPQRLLLLSKTVNLLFSFYTSLGQRLHVMTAENSPSFTVLSLLQLILSAFDWVVRTMPKLPSTDAERSAISVQCGKFLGAWICPLHVYRACLAKSRTSETPGAPEERKSFSFEAAMMNERQPLQDRGRKEETLPASDSFRGLCRELGITMPADRKPDLRVAAPTVDDDHLMGPLEHSDEERCFQSKDKRNQKRVNAPATSEGVSVRNSKEPNKSINTTDGETALRPLLQSPQQPQQPQQLQQLQQLQQPQQPQPSPQPSPQPLPHQPPSAQSFSALPSGSSASSLLSSSSIEAVIFRRRQPPLQRNGQTSINHSERPSVSGKQLLRVLEDLGVAGSSALQHVRSVMTLLLESNS